MSLFSRIKKDNKRILGNDDMVDIILTNPSNATETGKGRWTDIGFTLSPQGLPFAGKSYKVDFHIDNFPVLITSNDETFKGWKAKFTNNEGQVIEGTFTKPMVDKTFGYVSTGLNP